MDGNIQKNWKFDTLNLEFFKLQRVISKLIKIYKNFVKFPKKINK